MKTRRTWLASPRQYGHWSRGRAMTVSAQRAQTQKCAHGRKMCVRGASRQMTQSSMTREGGGGGRGGGGDPGRRIPGDEGQPNAQGTGGAGREEEEGNPHWTNLGSLANDAQGAVRNLPAHDAANRGLQEHTAQVAVRNMQAHGILRARVWAAVRYQVLPREVRTMQIPDRANTDAAFEGVLTALRHNSVGAEARA